MSIICALENHTSNISFHTTAISNEKDKIQILLHSNNLRGIGLHKKTINNANDNVTDEKNLSTW